MLGNLGVLPEILLRSHMACGKSLSHSEFHFPNQKRGFGQILSKVPYNPKVCLSSPHPGQEAQDCLLNKTTGWMVSQHTNVHIQSRQLEHLSIFPQMSFVSIEKV